MSEQHNFAELVRSRTAELASRTAYVFLGDTRDGLEPRRLSYGELDRSARTIAAWLQQHCAPGEPVLVLQSAGHHFISSFLGCLYAGVVAVPAPPPGGGRHHTERAVAIVKDAGTTVVLTDSAHAPDVSLRLAEAGHAEVRCLATDRIVQADPDDWRMPRIAPDALAFLQYTSGSTSEPKGVMVGHDNLLANQAAIRRAMRTDGDSVVGGWLPFHHDMGLVGHLLHPLWLGATGVLMSPSAFVRRPVNWLRMIDDYGITTGGGPNFGYELCLRRVTDEQIAELDLSRWATAVNGAEPVRAETMRGFAERFAPAGLRPEALYPCYGMAEATLFVTGGTHGTRAAERTVDAEELAAHRIAEPVEGRAARTLVSSGRPADTDVRIVDPESLQSLPDGTVGEIWIRGASVARGYWRRPGQDAQAFRAATTGGARGAREAGFLRTGDLGTLIDGELYVTGRLKEIVIMSGRNLYPQDIERTVQRVSLLFGSGAAFSVDTGREQVVLVQEVRMGTRGEVDLEALAAEVQQCISAEFGVAAGNVVLVRPGTVRRTTSGKMQRGVMRKLFLNGEIRPLHQVLDPDLSELVPAVHVPDTVAAAAALAEGEWLR
ncbi:fatty acyl-AMP ligase [Kitasatospora sp. NPDC059571]|uniref:fatty acyl-AMP ligase n=1 Tax=Kitasatospora sp. NPDC059571 TaxID=3346871 RepID=UPI003683D2E5